MRSIELLAPARNLRCGRAAIQHGADAVYIGPPAFGAREAAGNSIDDIARLLEFAHRYWVKVYATLNTLLRDEEIPEALRLIRQLHEIGVDGLIIQDVGLLECSLPPIPLTASTQMHNRTPERIAFLEKVGFQRVVLPREFGLDQIRAVREAAPTIELEAFVHGALCVSYSGQCYMSYALGGRSANRGQCAQPCRKPYTLQDGRGRIVDRRHLLSLRDLKLTAHLEELIRSGVTSFKIEGRLKDETYVSNIVALYRAELDRLLPAMGLERSSSGSSPVGFMPDPERTFNRGFTPYFIHGRKGKVGSLDTPKMVGPPVGTVVSIDRTRVTLDTEAGVHPGDGLCFFDRRGELRGSRVNDAHGLRVELETSYGIEPGTILCRNHDHRFMLEVERSNPVRKITVHGVLRPDTAERLCLEVSDEDGVSSEAFLPGPFPVAQKPEEARATIRKQLSKTGNTEFLCTSMRIETNPVPFVPVSALNSLRREALEGLTRARQSARPLVPVSWINNQVPFPEKELTWRGNVLNEKAAAFYRHHGVAKMEPAAESGLDLQNKAVMTMRYCIRYELGYCPKRGGTRTLPDPLILDDDEGNRFRLEFDCTACEMSVYLETRATGRP